MTKIHRPADRPSRADLVAAINHEIGLPRDNSPQAGGDARLFVAGVEVPITEQDRANGRFMVTTGVREVDHPDGTRVAVVVTPALRSMVGRVVRVGGRDVEISFTEEEMTADWESLP